MPTGTFLSDSFRSGDDNRSKGAPSQPSYFGAGGPQPTGSMPRGAETGTMPRGGGSNGSSSPNILGIPVTNLMPQAGAIAGAANQGSGFFQYGGGPGAGMIGQGAGSGYQSMIDAFNGPQSLLQSDQMAQIQSLLGRQMLDSDYQAGILRRDNSLAEQLLGLDRQQLGLDRGLTQGQLGNIGRLREILNKRRGIAGETKANQLGGLQINEDEARDMAGRKQWDLRSDLTQRGAFNTVANERGTGRINRSLDYEIRGINNQRSAADIQYRNSLLGLDEQSIGYDNQVLSLNNKLANIGLDSERLGIKSDQLNNALADALDQIGLGGLTTIPQLSDQYTQGTPEQQAMAQEVWNLLLGTIGLPPIGSDIYKRTAPRPTGGSRNYG